jgi:hypothetical protein
MTTHIPPKNNGAADAFTTRQEIDAIALALADFEDVNADNAFSEEVLGKAASLARDGEEATKRALFARVRRILGERFFAWELKVLMRAALGPQDHRECILRTVDASSTVGALLRVLEERHAEAGLYRRADVLGIVSDDAPARFRHAPWETIATKADEMLAVFAVTKNKDGETVVSRVSALSLRREYNALLGGDMSRMPELKGFAYGAVLRPDGTVFEGKCFDTVSGYYACDCERAPLAEPTKEAAREALLQLLDPFVDFPFEGVPIGRKPTADELAENPHASAIVAAILTAVCRSAFSGPAPGFIIEGNTRGAGKTLLARVIGLIATGANLPVSTIASDEAEQRKSVLSRMLAADPVVILDNAKGTLGGEAIEAALTSESFSDRLLGQSKSVTARNSTLWLITGNNATVTSDLARRIQPVRLSYPAERPEDRDPSRFKFPDLLGYVREHRAELYAHAITLVRAFILAGRPKPERAVRAYGSFESWDAIVRHALLFVGAADPDVARQDFRERADLERDSVSELLHLLRDLSTARHNGEHLTAQDILKACTDANGRETDLMRALRDVGVRGWSPTARGIGKALANLRDTACDGWRLEGRLNRDKVMMWKVVPAAGFAVVAGFGSPTNAVESPQSNQHVSVFAGFAGVDTPPRGEVSVERVEKNSGDWEQTRQTPTNPAASPTPVWANLPDDYDHDDYDVTVYEQLPDGTRVVLHDASKGRR